MVRTARMRKGWSQATLAETAQVGHDVIQRVEAGLTDPPASLVFNLTRCLGLDVRSAIYNQIVARRVDAGDDTRVQGAET